MCGIIARVSSDTNPIKTLKGLKFLEYRGYDSYGVLLFNNSDGLNVLNKNVSELSESDISKLSLVKSNIEIGHTRWATHGGVTSSNAHPHFDESKSFYVVMNGIIENYLDVKSDLKNSGVKFSSETDTEILPHLFAKYFKDTGFIERDLLTCSTRVFEDLKGEFSFVVKYKNAILAYKNINPIAVGVSESSGEIYLCSDSGLVQNNSDKFYILADSEVFTSSISPEGQISSHFFRDLVPFDPEFKSCVKTATDDSNEFSTYMEKEIYEQKNLRNIVTTENLSAIKYLKNALKHGRNVVLTAAGTSYHAAYVMHHELLRAGIMSTIIVASELHNYRSVISDSMIVVFTQSGETADLIYPLRELRDSNEIFTITNTANSTLARFANRIVMLNCGREVSVASTKAFTAQVFVSHLLSYELAGKHILDNLSIYENDFDNLIKSCDSVLDEVCGRFAHNQVNVNLMDSNLDTDSSMRNGDLSQIHLTQDVFFIGRNQFHPFALEGALKLKEVSYIHAEGFAGGELKHGTLALITDNVPVVVLGNCDEIVSNAIEVKTRGGVLIGIGSRPNSIFNYFIEVPKNFEEILGTVVMQLLALKMTQKLGLNPDKPRNLAKSVTVK
jgi:glucosamine--fructose-6-phosphate aminotransferase (isomerizing)